MHKNLLFVCCKVNGGVREQPQTTGEVSFPKATKSLISVNNKETMRETPFAVKSAHLTLNFDHF